MIKLQKKPPTPKILQTEKVKKLLLSISQKVEANYEVKPEDFDSSIWRADEVRISLWEYQHKKCCYCERKRDPKREPDIEHYRPKTEIKNVGKPGYWWLSYNWDNLFFSCKHCNQNKSSHFPLLSGNHVRTPDGDLKQEKPLFPKLDDEDPEELIDYIVAEGTIDLAWPVGKDREGRGDKIIEMLDLKNPDLAEERGNFLMHLRGVNTKRILAEHFNDKEKIKEIKKEIEKETRANNPFAGFRRAYLTSLGSGKYIKRE